MKSKRVFVDLSDVVDLDGEPMAARLPAPRPPVDRPSGTGAKWWGCENPNCQACGSVATASEQSFCPYCKLPMRFVQQGGFPQGMARMTVPAPPDRDMKGQATFHWHPPS